MERIDGRCGERTTMTSHDVPSGKEMRQRDCFLRRLHERVDGRIDRTVHAYLHIAIPLLLPRGEMERCINDLIALGLIEADPGFAHLIRLTPRGITACEEIGTVESAVFDPRENTVEWHGFAVPRDMYADLATAQERATD